MIKSLSIKNYALIQSLEMLPAPTLNIITGETGAGKSIMLGAVGLLLGNRADTKALFSEEEKCVVEGIFDISQYELESFFEAEELEFEKECIIRREINPGGKSRAFVNDTPVTLEVLKTLGSRLMDVHSQHETLQLGSNLYQQEILDIYCENQTHLTTYRQAYTSWQKATRALENLERKAAESNKEQDYHQYLYQELVDANLQSGEQEELEQELELLENAEEIKLNLTRLAQLLDESEFAVVQQLKEAASLMSPIKGFSKKLEELHERIASAGIELQDVASEVANEQDRVELDPERLLVVKDRIDLLFRLEQKHQAKGVDQLLKIRDELGEQLEQTLQLDEQLAAAKKQVASAEKAVLEAGAVLSKRRKAKSTAFAQEIQTLIANLGIENGKVAIELQGVPPGPHGMDLVEMLFSANKGVAPRELKSVASGGEFSRLIFAIKYLMANKTALPTLIFDEIDTGVSGEIALQMARMMKKMAKNHQVVAISHLPQLAAGGDAHYFVFKDHSSDKSVSKIKKLQDEERVLAIARMIGGDHPGANALESARELLATV